jgi:hypothetical protein
VSAAAPPNGAVPATVLAERYPFVSDLVLAVERAYPGGVRATADPATQVAACLACRSKAHPDPARKFPLVLRSGLEGAWRIARTCGCSEQAILAELAGIAGPARLPFVSAAELRASTPDEPPWVWDGYFARGAVSIVAGRPKVGKSTLVCAVLEAVVSGAPRFLGRAVGGGAAVYVSEESAGTLAGKLPLSERLSVLTRQAAWPRPPWPDVVAGAAEECERAGAALLVVDTLSFWGQLPPERENDSGAAQQAMEPLLEAAAAGLAVAVVHHQRKAGGEDGVAVRGSSGLAGSADALVEVERARDRAPRLRRVVALTRWPQSPPELVADRDPATAAWRVVEDARPRPAQERDEAAERVLAVLAEAGGDRLSGAEVARRQGKTKDDSSVHRALRRLEERGLAARDGSGWGLSLAEATTLPGLEAPKPGSKRSQGVVSGTYDTPDNPTTDPRCQGGVVPFRGPADGNPPGGGGEER